MFFSASDGCLQYFTGVSGQMFSFNYNDASGLQLSNTDYSICVRMERNFCGIQYTACTDSGKYDLKVLYCWPDLLFQSIPQAWLLASQVEPRLMEAKWALHVPPIGLPFHVPQIATTPHFRPVLPQSVSTEFVAWSSIRWLHLPDPIPYP